MSDPKPAAPKEMTPTPWEFDGNCGGYVTQGGAKIARAYSHADAAGLVLAVNSHARLRDELRTMVNRFGGRAVNAQDHAALKSSRELLAALTGKD